jgi:16S rRNA (uracil1498-N3)-methyltransferase
VANKHEFALYWHDLSKIVMSGQHEFMLANADILNRIKTILRLQIGQKLVLFDRFCSVEACIRNLTKKFLEGIIISRHMHTVVKPSVTVALPLLKREAFEQACYGLTELGITALQPLITQKIHRVWFGAKEHERLMRVMIAAAEQSKNFALPELYAPQMFNDFLQQCSRFSHKVYYDPDGQSLFPLLVDLQSHKNTANLICIVGPEGDLTVSEKEQLCHAGFVFYTLGSTVLRAVHAIQLGVGALRLS